MIHAATSRRGASDPFAWRGEFFAQRRRGPRFSIATPSSRASAGSRHGRTMGLPTAAPGFRPSRPPGGLQASSPWVPVQVTTDQTTSPAGAGGEAGGGRLGLDEREALADGHLDRPPARAGSTCAATAAATSAFSAGHGRGASGRRCRVRPTMSCISSSSASRRPHADHHDARPGRHVGHALARRWLPPARGRRRRGRARPHRPGRNCVGADAARVAGGPGHARLR